MKVDGSCHCTDCQALSGSPWQPKIYVKKSDDGTPRAQGFCGDCGSALGAPSRPPDLVPVGAFVVERRI